MIARRALLGGCAALLVPAAARAAPLRVAVAGGGLGEMAVALGAEAALCGVDSTCLFPGRLRALPQMGYMRALAAEGVLSLRPDLLLLSADAGPPPAVAQLRAAGLRVVQTGRIQSPAELAAAVRLVAEALERPAEGARIAAAIEGDFATLAARLPPSRPRAVFVLAPGQGAPMVAGSGTAADAVLRAAGAENALSHPGYRPIAAEAVLAARPDWIVGTRHTPEASDAFLGQPPFSLLPAARERRVVVMDSAFLLGWGPRAPHAVAQLAAALHRRPELATLPDRPWLREGA